MSAHRRKLPVTAVTVDLGCSSSFCGRLKLSSIFTPSTKPKNPKPKHQIHNHSSASTATWTHHKTKTSRAVQGFGRIGGESVAVEKDSEDPYLDFRRSILQMIVEKEIYSKDDLKELLNCFLQLNAPVYHGVILTAFTEIWHGVFFGR